jgi:hypothetical protein
MTDCLLVQSYQAVHAISQVEYSVIGFPDATVFQENVQLAGRITELNVFQARLFFTNEIQKFDSVLLSEATIC